MLRNVDRHLRHGRPNGQELEALRATRPDGDYVILVAIHVEPLEEPGVADRQVGSVWSALHGAVRGAKTSANAHHSRVISRVHGRQSHKERADRDGRDGIAAIGAKRDRTVALDEADGAGRDGVRMGRIIRHPVAHVAHRQRSACVSNTLQGDQIVEELHGVAYIETHWIQGQDHQLVAGERRGIGIERIPHLVAVKVEPVGAQTEQ